MPTGVGGSEAPWHGASGDDGDGDSHAWPVEIAVVAELGAGVPEFMQQQVRGDAWPAFDADQRGAPGAEDVGGGLGYGRVLADEHLGWRAGGRDAFGF